MADQTIYTQLRTLAKSVAGTKCYVLTYPWHVRVMCSWTLQARTCCGISLVLGQVHIIIKYMDLKGNGTNHRVATGKTGHCR